MQRHSELFSHVDMGKAGWVCNYGVGDERFLQRVMVVANIDPGRVLIQLGKAWCRTQSFTCLYARPPAAEDDLLDSFSPLGDLAALQSIEARHETGVFDHERHELGGVSADAEEFETVLLDKLLEDGVGSDTDSVPISVLQNLAECHERLHVATRSYDLDDDV